MDLPQHAIENLPILYKTIDKYWDSLQEKYYLAAQIQKETCQTLKSPTCWTEKAELKTYNSKGCLIEYGFGFGQTTITRSTKTCNIRYNNFDYIKSLNSDLKDWSFQDRYNKQYQMTAFVSYDKILYTNWNGKAINGDNQIAFMLSSYNGGSYGLAQDIEYCKSIENCNPKIWWGNVERYSLKSKSNSNYKNSPFSINRQYVSDIMKNISPKYKEYQKNLTKTDSNVIKEQNNKSIWTLLFQKLWP